MTDTQKSLTAERLREIMDYDPDTGVFTLLSALLRAQEPLGADFEAVWDANVADLYED